MIRIRWSGGSSSVFSSELAAWSLARSTWSIRKTRRLPLCGRYCAASFSRRVCGMEIWRSGPSGAKVTKSGWVANSSGSSLRFSAVHFSRAATVSRLSGRPRSSFSISSAMPQQARRHAPRQGRLAHAFGPGEEQRLRQALLRDHLLQRFGDRGVAPEILKHGRSRCSRLRVRFRRCRRGRPPV